MAIDYTQLFTTQGLYCGGLNEVNTFRGATLDARRTDVRTQLVTDSVYDELVSPLETARDAVDSVLDPWVTFLSASAREALFDDVIADRPISNPTLETIVQELVRQMGVDSQTLVECPCTASIATVSATGSPSFVNVRHEGKTGRVSDFLVPDVWLIRCTADRSNGGTSYGETFTVTGKARDTLVTSADYPSGSGVNASVIAKNPASDGGMTTDPGFDTWVTNTPTYWTIYAGTAGTHVIKASDDPRTAGFSLNLVGDGSVIAKVRQAVSVSASTAYAFHARLKKVLDPGTDWAVSFLLTDSSGTALAGPAAYVNTISSAAATSIAASWANPVTGTFVTPAVIPSTGVYLEIRFHQSGSLTTAAANTASVYVDHVAMHAVAPGQFYNAGPGLVAYSGLAESVVGDTYTDTFVLSSGAIGDFLIRGMDRLLGLAGLTYRIPTTTSGAATISNALVT